MISRCQKADGVSFLTLKNAGDPIQYSVFKCELSTSDFKRMRDKLEKIIKSDEDRIHIFALGKSTDISKRVTCLGMAHFHIDISDIYLK